METGNLLNAVREGVLVERARAELNARTDPDFEPPDDEFWLTLAPTNRVVTARNRRQLERLPGDSVVHHAVERGDLSLFEPPVERALELKVGAQVPGVIGFAVGRTIFLDALMKFRGNEITRDQAAEMIAERFVHFYRVFNPQ